MMYNNCMNNKNNSRKGIKMTSHFISDWFELYCITDLYLIVLKQCKSKYYDIYKPFIDDLVSANQTLYFDKLEETYANVKPGATAIFKPYKGIFVLPDYPGLSIADLKNRTTAMMKSLGGNMQEYMRLFTGVSKYCKAANDYVCDLIKRREEK